MALLRAALVVVFVAAIAGLAAVLEPNAYPSYDHAFVLASAQDVLEGRASGYDVLNYSPVPHPLTLLVALAIVPLGDGAFAVFTALGFAALGLLCWALLRVGALLGSGRLTTIGLIAHEISTRARSPRVAVCSRTARTRYPSVSASSGRACRACAAGSRRAVRR